MYFLTDLMILGITYKWNQTVFVCTYCILKCIFKVKNMCPTSKLYLLFFPHPIQYLYRTYTVGSH